MTMNKSLLRIAGITYESLVDGPGMRVAVFTQGCDLGCPNCHNPGSHDPNLGREFTVAQLVRTVKKPGPGRAFAQGVTFSGGEPFMQAALLAEVAQKLKSTGWDVVTYTGHTLEKLIAKNDPGINALLSETDILIDGPYIDELRDLDLPFRGSTNQRVIDMNEMRTKI